MKTTLTFFILGILSFTALCQDVLNFGWVDGDHVSFEDTSQYKYVKLDSNNIWVITTPQKPILYLPSSLGNFGIMTDTNIYYLSDTASSFQFRLRMTDCSVYSLSFWHKYDFESNKDGGIIETSWDNGLTWKNIINDDIIQNNLHFSPENLYSLSDTINSFNGQPGFTGLQDSMVLVRIEFWAFQVSLGDTMLLRFTFKSDSNQSNNEGWLLDEFDFGGLLVSIDELRKPDNKVDVFPNPASSKIKISIEDESVTHVYLCSVLGDILLDCKNSDIVDVSDMSPGFYILKVNNKYSKTLIVE